MTKSIHRLALATVLILSLARGQDLWNKFAFLPAFSCSLSVMDIEGPDTFKYRGFLSISEHGFLINLGSDYFLQNTPGTLLTWTDGGDAMAVSAPKLYGLKRFTEVIDSLFAPKPESSACVAGKKQIADDQFPADEIRICFNSRGIPTKIEMSGKNHRTIALVKKPSTKPPDKSLFTLPSGVSIISNF